MRKSRASAALRRWPLLCLIAWLSSSAFSCVSGQRTAFSSLKAGPAHNHHEVSSAEHVRAEAGGATTSSDRTIRLASQLAFHLLVLAIGVAAILILLASVNVCRGKRGAYRGGVGNPECNFSRAFVAGRPVTGIPKGCGLRRCPPSGCWNSETISHRSRMSAAGLYRRCFQRPGVLPQSMDTAWMYDYRSCSAGVRPYGGVRPWLSRCRRLVTIRRQ